MTSHIKFAVTLPNAIITPISHTQERAIVLVTLELAMDYDDLAHLIGLVKGMNRYVVSFDALEDDDVVP